MSNIVVERFAQNISVLTLNRPDSLNSLTNSMVKQLSDNLDALERDDQCRVIIITGAGKGFCSGLDLTELSTDNHQEAPAKPTIQSMMEAQENYASLICRINETSKPIIAAVNGVATGAGLAIALAADTRLCGLTARFSAAFVRIGLSGCDVGVSYLLPKIVGPTLAFEMMLSGRLVDAAEADNSGLVLKKVPDEELMEVSIETASRIAENSPFGVKMTKQAMWSNIDSPSLRSAIALENRTQILCINTEDQKEAMAAFLQRRTGNYSNC